MKLYSILFVLAGLIITSCSKSDCEDGFTTNNFSLEKEYCLNDDESITIDSLLDSRCPLDVECVWEGQVNLFLTLKTKEEVHHHEVIFKNEDKVQIFNNINGYILKIESILPYPVASNDTTPEEYSIKMKIE